MHGLLRKRGRRGGHSRYNDALGSGRGRQARGARIRPPAGASAAAAFLYAFFGNGGFRCLQPALPHARRGRASGRSSWLRRHPPWASGTCGASPTWRRSTAAARSCSPTSCSYSRSACRSCCWRRRSGARPASRPSARSSSSARSTPSSASSPRPCRSSSRRTTASSAAG